MGPATSLPATPLIGRGHELEAIEAALSSLRRGSRCPCLGFAGALGLGKSRLLSELEQRADAGGCLVLTGRGSEWEAGIPYGVTTEALDDYLGALPDPDLERVTGGIAHELVVALPVLAPGTPAAPHPSLEAERYRTHRALRDLIGRLAERSPLVLVLDDLHWADGETAELVAHLVRHPPPRMLLAIAFRSAQLADPARAALQRGSRDGRVELLELGPLSDAESSELAAAVPEDARSAVVREAGGNPFFIEQLARAVVNAEIEPMRHDGTEGVPGAVLAAIETELGALDPLERSLLAGGAVAGEPFELDLAAAAAELDQRRALPILDALLAADLIRPADSPRRFAFRHPLVRRAVYQAAGPGWRLGAHGRVAAALRGRGAPVATIADHIERSAQPGDETAITTLLDAGGLAARRAPATAARHFRAALDLLPAGADSRRLEILVALATSQGGAGRPEEARETLSEVLAKLPPEAHELRARAATFMARLDHALGRQGEARALLERTLAELPEPRSREAATLTFELSMDHLFTGEFDQLLERVEAALGLARELGDPLLEAASLAGVAHAAQNLRDIPASLAAAERAAAIVDELDDTRCAPLLETFWWLAEAENVLERWDDSLRHAERGIRLARAYGVNFVFVALTHILAEVFAWQGRLGRAREAAAATVDASHLSGIDSSVAYAYTAQCFVHVQAGEAAEALPAGELAAELGRSLRRGLFVSLPHSNLGAALLEAGEPERARAQLLEARSRGALDHWVGRCFWEIRMSGAELALGRLEEAERWTAAAETTAEEMGLAGRLGSARAARAALHLARGDAPSAAAVADEAAELLDRCGRPADAARARILAGRARAVAGDHDRAVTELGHARAALIEAGAPRLADEAARELRKLGRRVARPGGRGASANGVGSLSAREREIAELVAAGHTNREIAGAVHLSEKTVANHLSRIFAKLGISSRSALAAAIGRDHGA